MSSLQERGSHSPRVCGSPPNDGRVPCPNNQFAASPHRDCDGPRRPTVEALRGCPTCCQRCESIRSGTSAHPPPNLSPSVGLPVDQIRIATDDVGHGTQQG